MSGNDDAAQTPLNKFCESIKEDLNIPPHSQSDFTTKCKTAFNAINRFYGGKAITDDTLTVLQHVTFGEKVKDFLLFLLKIITLGIAAIPDATTSTKKNKEEAQSFAAFLNAQNNQRPIERQ